jgi:hypothetical protein
MNRRSLAAGRLVVVALIAIAALLAAGIASASRTDAGVLNQTQTSDATGDSGRGPDLSSLTVTTYTDGTVSFAAGFANRSFLQPGETVQVFIDLNDDGKADLNLSIWQSFEPSYLDRASGSDWVDIRQLPELVQTSGSVSVRLSLSELQSDGAVPVAPTIQVAVGSWTEDANGNVPQAANDWIPSATTWFDHSVKPAATTGTTTTGSTTTRSSGSSGAATAPATKTTKTSSPPVTIEPIPALTARAGKDVMLHVLLKSHAGPMRLFKVCTQAAGVPHPTQCRSAESTGAKVVPFSITYRLGHPGTTRISIAASAGTAKATATATVHVA